jgi:hypothetical protein
MRMARNSFSEIIKFCVGGALSRAGATLLKRSPPPKADLVIGKLHDLIDKVKYIVSRQTDEACCWRKRWRIRPA